MKNCYEQACKDIIHKLNSCGDNFCFAVVADSHLDNSVPETCDNIRKVSEAAPLSCVLHLGDIMCDGFPRKTLNRLMKKEIEMFCDCAPSGHFLPTRGNHDGFKDYIRGASAVRLDADWYEATKYIETLPKVSRPEGKPYFYVDYPEKKIRLIALNSFFYDEVTEDTAKGAHNGYDDEQLDWFRNDALSLNEEWTVIAFTHDSPIKKFDESFAENNPIYNGNAMMDAIKSGMKKNGFRFAAWLVGHYHGDLEYCADGINIVLVASETAYVPTLWDMPEGGYYPDRALGTETEDLWDAVCVDTETRVLRFFRFGAGKDRVISY